jgi:predicted anti-sigma-YlaC factor YlaD
MTCRDLQALTGNYLNGELPEELGDGIQRHLLKCPACREEIDSQKRAVEILKVTHASPNPGEAFIQSALQRLGDELDLDDAATVIPGQLVLGIGAGRRLSPFEP